MDDIRQHKPTMRVLDILEFLASNPDGYTLTEISTAINAAKGTIFPIIQTLNDRKFIFKVAGTGKYQIGINAFSVGESYTNSKSIMKFINAEMRTIVDKVGEICQMGILDGGDVLYISKVDNQEAIRLISYVGKRLPAYCTALGKALLSGQTEEEIKRIYPKGLKKFTVHTITSFKELNNELKKVRTTHIASEREEVEEHLCCLATPLTIDGKTVAALSVSAPTFRSSKTKEKLITKELLSARMRIETYLSTEHFSADNFIFNN